MITNFCVVDNDDEVANVDQSFRRNRSVSAFSGTIFSIASCAGGLQSIFDSSGRSYFYLSEPRADTG